MENVRRLADYTLRMAKSTRANIRPLSRRNIPSELKALRERGRMTMAELATAMGYKGASSYQRYEDATLFKKDHLPFEVIQRLAKVLVGRGNPPIEDTDVYALGPEQVSIVASPRKEQLFPMPVVGLVQAGVWTETDELQDGPEIGRLPVKPSPNQPEEGQYALMVRGESMNRVAKDGDYIICVDVDATYSRPHPGDLVVVERSRDGGIYEYTVKRLMTEPDGQLILMPESDDPLYQQPIPLGDSKTDRVIIKAIVLMVLSLQHATARFDYSGRR